MVQNVQISMSALLANLIVLLRANAITLVDLINADVSKDISNPNLAFVKMSTNVRLKNSIAIKEPSVSILKAVTCVNVLAE
jgi:adenylate cyclase